MTTFYNLDEYTLTDGDLETEAENIVQILGTFSDLPEQDEPVFSEPRFPAPGFITETEIPEVPHYTGPVWTMDDTPDAEYVRNQSEAVSREAHKGLHAHELIEAEQDELAEALEREAEREVWDTRAQAQITCNVRTGWVTYTSGQEKTRVTVNTTTRKLTIKIKPERRWITVDEHRYDSAKAALEAQETVAAWAAEWLRSREMSDKVAIGKTQAYPAGECVAKARAWRDALKMQDVECNVRFIR